MPVNLMADVPEPYIHTHTHVYIYIYIYIFILQWEWGVWVENITSRKYVTEMSHLQQTQLTSYIVHIIHPV